MAIDLQRDALVKDRSLAGTALTTALRQHYDDWLGSLFVDSGADPTTYALVALGGFGRGDVSPQSDLDLLLVHEGAKDLTAVAEALWYPVWDADMKLGHIVATRDELLKLAKDDLQIATTMLSGRHLAGSVELSQEVIERAKSQWRSGAKRYLAELDERMQERQAEFGEVAFRLEPDLKEGRGGLRDVHAIGWAEATEPVLIASEASGLSEPYQTILAARVELHRVTNRRSDSLLLEVQDEVAKNLGYDDADHLMADIAAAARSIAWTSDGMWHRIRRSLRQAKRRTTRPREVAPGILLEDRVVRVGHRVNVATEPEVTLRLAVAAATHRAYVDRETLDLLAAEAPPMPDPWPEGARDLFADLLLTGQPAIGVIETLDQVGLFSRILPEWEPCRSRPQRNAYHRFTVDRHLCEAAAIAAELVDSVENPDLLVLGALLHDIGKGYPGDHTIVGMKLVETIATRMGYDEHETSLLVAMVKLHLLLPDVATRRDLDDDGTIRYVAAEVGSIETLHLLGALTEADSIATGSSAWGPWKAELVERLVERTSHVLRGGAVEEVIDLTFPTAVHWEMLRSGETLVEADGDTITVVTDDRTGIFRRIAGVLAFNGLEVREAAAYADETRALNVFHIGGQRAHRPAWEQVVADVELVLAGRIAISARVAARAKTYKRKQVSASMQSVPTVVFDNDTSAQATVIEVTGPDSVGVLYRITKALAEFDLSIVTAKVHTLGHEVVDTFYVRTGQGEKVLDPLFMAEIERGVLHGMSASF